MDLTKTLAELYEEKSRLDKVIATLEELGNDPFTFRVVAQRRGRKFMSPQERRQVSERMRKYWAGRKASQHVTQHMDPPRTMQAASAA